MRTLPKYDFFDYIAGFSSLSESVPMTVYSMEQAYEYLKDCHFNSVKSTSTLTPYTTEIIRQRIPRTRLTSWWSAQFASDYITEVEKMTHLVMDWIFIVAKRKKYNSSQQEYVEENLLMKQPDYNVYPWVRGSDIYRYPIYLIALSPTTIPYVATHVSDYDSTLGETGYVNVSTPYTSADTLYADVADEMLSRFGFVPQLWKSPILSTGPKAESVNQPLNITLPDNNHFVQDVSEIIAHAGGTVI